MDDASWVKPAVIGAAAGATVGVLLFGGIGFTAGGWMTTGGADKMYLAVAHETMIAAMVPVCLDLSANDADRAAKLTRRCRSSPRQTASTDTFGRAKAGG